MSNDMKSDREMCLAAMKTSSHYEEGRREMFQEHVAKELQRDEELRKAAGISVRRVRK